MNKTAQSQLSLIAIFLVFLAMGFGDAAGQLVSVVEKAFGISPFAASLVSFAGMIMFGVLSIPMGVQQSKIGKKKMLTIGLIFFLLGAILPIVAFNFPVILVASAEGKYSSNLSFAQAIKAIGTLSTSLIVSLMTIHLINNQWFKLIAENGESMNIGFRILFPIFAIILLITLILVIVFVLNKKMDGEQPTTLANCMKALGDPYILMMFFGIFFYCGAEASMFNRIPSILLENNPNIPSSVGNIVLIVSLFIGRLLGGITLRFIKPNHFLWITLIISVIGNLFLFMPYNSITTWLSFLLIGIGFANIFPLIFSIAIDRKPQMSNEISGLMVTAIVGAAIVPLATGAAANVNPKYAFIVTLICLGYIAFVAFKNKR